MKFKVTHRATGKVHHLTAEELARIPRAPAARARRHSFSPVPADMNRNTAIKLIREALKKRSGKMWSVTGGSGTGWGWIHVSAPPARRLEYGSMNNADKKELAELLGLDSVHDQGHSIPASNEYRLEYIARARGEEPTVYGTQYWD